MQVYNYLQSSPSFNFNAIVYRCLKFHSSSYKLERMTKFDDDRQETDEKQDSRMKW